MCTSVVVWLFSHPPPQNSHSVIIQFFKIEECLSNSFTSCANSLGSYAIITTCNDAFFVYIFLIRPNTFFPTWHALLGRVRMQDLSHELTMDIVSTWGNETYARITAGGPRGPFQVSLNECCCMHLHSWFSVEEAFNFTRVGGLGIPGP